MAVVLLLAGGLVGCGGSASPDATTPKMPVRADQRDVLDTIDVLQVAGRRGDGKKICRDVFTAGLAESVSRASSRSCAREVRSKLFRSGESISVRRGVEIDGSAATAVILDQRGNTSTLHMLKEVDGWRIARITPGGAS